MSALLVNPFAKATSNGPAANQGPNKQAPAGPNAGNPNSGTDPTSNVGNNQVNPDPNNPNGPNTSGTNPSNNPSNGNDPMMDFSKLWETAPDDPKNPKPAKVKYVPDMDQEQLSKTVNNMDFTSSISPEARAKMIAGGEDGMNAFFDALNNVGRQATATAYQAAHRMTAASLDRAEKGFTEQVPSFVRSSQTDSQLSANPLVSNPAYAPLVNSVKSQYLAQFPKASPEQISTAVNGYFDNMLKDLNKKNAPKEQDNKEKLKSGAGDANWEDWLPDDLKS